MPLGCRGEKQATSCKKRKESAKNAKQQGQWGTCGFSREKAQEQLIWCKEIIVTAAQLFAGQGAGGGGSSRGPRRHSPVLPMLSPVAGSRNLL